MNTPRPRPSTRRPGAHFLLLRLAPAMAFVVLGAGCVGYNQTLFYTKSNAGLDFDAKPPTSEISVSRKEGVITPSFEGGKTPPVMASFKPHGGHGNTFENFFFGVDQTFAGGNAAIAMAQLYDSSLPGSSIESDYDSAIEVAEPQAPLCWQKVPAAPAARPFVFATDTLWGVKIGWTGQMPDSVKVGFNREEIAWAPISKEGAAAGNPAKVKLRIPSFLATIDHNVKVEGASLDAGSIQYFATGRAATLLARQPAVRRAMLARLDPANTFRVHDDVLGDGLLMVQSVINRRAEFGDTTAIRHKNALAALTGINLPSNAGTSYDYAATTNTLKESRPQIVPNSADLSGLIGYNDFLAKNTVAINAAIRAIDRKESVSYEPLTGNRITAQDAVYAQVRAAHEAVTEASENFRVALSTNRTVTEAYRYALDSITPR